MLERFIDLWLVLTLAAALGLFMLALVHLLGLAQRGAEPQSKQELMNMTKTTTFHPLAGRGIRRAPGSCSGLGARGAAIGSSERAHRFQQPPRRDGDCRGVSRNVHGGVGAHVDVAA